MESGNHLNGDHKINNQYDVTNYCLRGSSRAMSDEKEYFGG